MRHSLTPARLLVLSFLLLIGLGTAGLLTLPGLYAGPRLGFLDALFTATSAVCVTGLVVTDTATRFTPLGQAFLLVLIQLGGLGILTFTTLLILTLGRRLSLHHEAVTAGPVDVAPDVDFRNLVRNIVRFTLAFEAVGALVLFLAFLPRFPVLSAAWHALFHSVSAFCNAGFSTFSDSLVGFQRAPVTQLAVMALIVAGGIGFLTLEEFHVRWRDPRRRKARLSLHSRLVLVATAALIVGGWVAFALLEWRNTLAGLPGWSRLLNGLFLSVTARTAGFNTVDYGAASDGTNFLTVLLMSVGGSPGSTAGGLKTTTFAVIVLLALGRLRGNADTGVHSRTLPGDTVQRAVGLFVVGFAIVTGATLLLVVMEGGAGPGGGGERLLTWMFEAASAFNTVGLTMGGTAELSEGGKCLVVALMYLGRVGPLTVAAALLWNRPRLVNELRFATEDVIVG